MKHSSSRHLRSAQIRGNCRHKKQVGECIRCGFLAALSDAPGARFYNPTMTHHFDICIRGGGIVGHTLALLLARDRLRIGLVAPQTPPDSEPDVRAYALNAKSKALLESVRCWPDEAHATPVHGHAGQGR